MRTGQATENRRRLKACATWVERAAKIPEGRRARNAGGCAGKWRPGCFSARLSAGALALAEGGGAG